MTVAKSSSPRKPRQRAYHSALRDEAARRTRERIVLAATDCFTRSGYASTTLKAIAAEAGVSVETVNNNGPKRDLLMAAFTTAFAGSEDLGSMAEHPDLAASFGAQTAEAALTVVLDGLIDAFARSDGIWRAVTAAADQDAEVAGALDAMLQRRHADFALMVEALERRGLPVGRGRERRVDAAVAIVNHETYHQLVVRAGWSAAEYRLWLSRMLVHALVDDDR